MRANLLPFLLAAASALAITLAATVILAGALRAVLALRTAIRREREDDRRLRAARPSRDLAPAWETFLGIPDDC